MSDAFRMALETPPDRLVTDRAQFFSGWFQSADPGFRLRARCGGLDVPVAEFRHPDRLFREGLRGFWGVVAPQDFGTELDGGWLRVDFRWGEASVGGVAMPVSPAAVEVARRCPLSRKRYRVRNRGRSRWTGERPRALIFPGLGGVGGSSLNALMRMEMLKRGWETPIRGEANDKGLWASLGRLGVSDARWIDGHDCHGAGRFLKGPWARVTLLREPEARLISLYNWGVLATPLGFPYRTFDEFVHSPDALGFTQAYGLLRMAGWTPPPDAGEEEIHREARAELRRAYALVGVTELFEETLFLLCDLAGHEEIGMWWRFLSAPAFVRRETISPAAAQRLKEITAVDRKLHEEWRHKLLALAGEAEFGEALAEYKRDAAAQPGLTDAEKLAECLRWRLRLAEEELGALRARLEREGRR